MNDCSTEARTLSITDSSWPPRYRFSIIRKAFCMKIATCPECGFVENGSSDKDVMSKMESHISNEHPEGDAKKMMKSAERSLADE